MALAIQCNNLLVLNTLVAPSGVVGLLISYSQTAYQSLSLEEFHKHLLSIYSIPDMLSDRDGTLVSEVWSGCKGCDGERAPGGQGGYD